MIDKSRALLASAAAGVACVVAVASSTVASTSEQRRPTFVNDVAPILAAHCASCHRPGTFAPFPLITYEEVREKGADIVKAVSARHMPPWHAEQGPGFVALSGDRRLSDRQIATLRTWVANGTPSGDLRRALPPDPYPTVWPLGIPDVTLSLPGVITIPADAGHIYRNVVIPIGLPVEVWLAAIDYQPASHGALKHIRFFLTPPDFSVEGDDVLPGMPGLLGRASLENFADRVIESAAHARDLGSWTPGIGRAVLEDGLAIRVPPRANLIVQMHLQAGDTDAVEDGRVALYYSKAPRKRGIIPVDISPASGFGAAIAIPAGAVQHVVTDRFTLPIDVEAVGARGFAHALAREMTMLATPPGARPRGILNITNWDPAWPETYYFATPLKLPKGTVLRSDIVYDNSAANPRVLLQIPRRTSWGRMPGGEMGMMTLLILEPDADGSAVLSAALRAHLLRQLVR